MNSLVRNIIQQSVYQIAKGTVENIEKQMKEEDAGKENLRRQLLVVSTVHTLLGYYIMTEAVVA